MMATFSVYQIHPRCQQFTGALAVDSARPQSNRDATLSFTAGSDPWNQWMAR
jgi:hypothetical protein